MSNIQLPAGTQRLIINPNEIILGSKIQKISVRTGSSVSIVNAGPVGPPGVQGESIQPAYFHVQEVPSDEWTITHNLLFRPAGVFVQDSSGANVEGDVSYVSDFVIVINFSSAFSGLCYLS